MIDLNIELFVNEPKVMSPVEMVFDENSRIYVAEILDYPTDPPRGKPARSRIRLLKIPPPMAKSTTLRFLPITSSDVSGLMPRQGGLVVTS
jgi:hypothetical protein